MNQFVSLDREVIFIKEEELLKIYLFHYNDIFSEILQLDKSFFLTKLKESVLIHLKIIHKQAQPNVLAKVETFIAKKYANEFNNILNDFNTIKKISENPSVCFLGRAGAYLHCIRCSNALHTCGERYVLFDEKIFCLKCSKVYTEYHAKMLCDACGEEYYTKLREIKNGKPEKFVPVAFKNYHCLTEYEEKMFCKECGEILYADIDKCRIQDKIKQIICLNPNCRCIYNVNEMVFICHKCGSNFESEAKLYNGLSDKQIYILNIVHILIERKLACPTVMVNRRCQCNLTDVKKYNHEDGGVLYEGIIKGQKVIICVRCFKIFNYSKFEWTCPGCGEMFTSREIPSELEPKFLSLSKLKSEEITKKSLAKKMDSNKKSNKISMCDKDKDNLIKENLLSSKDEKPKQGIQGIRVPKTQSINIQIQNFVNGLNQMNNQISPNKAKIFELINGSNNNKQSINNLKRVKSKYKEESSNTDDGNIGNGLNRRVKKQQNYSKDKNFKKDSLQFYLEQQNKNNMIEEKNKNFSLIKGNNLNVMNDKKQNDLMYKNIGNQKLKHFSNFLKNQNENNKTNNNNDNTPNDSSDVSNHSRKSRRKSNNRSTQHYSVKNSLGIKGNRIQINKNKLLMNNINVFDDLEENEQITQSPVIESGNDLISQDDKSQKRGSFGFKNKNVYKINNLPVLDLTPKNHQGKIPSLDNDHNRPISLSNLDAKDYKKSTGISNESDFKYKQSEPVDSSSKSTSVFTNTNSNGTNQHPQNGTTSNNNENLLISETIKTLRDFNIDDYNIIRQLGEGSFGKIYLVEDQNTKERYALKTLSINNHEDLCESQKFESLKSLSRDYPDLNIIKIFGVQFKQLDKFNQALYVLMEAANSDWEKEIKERAKKRQYYTENELIKILKSIVRTMSTLQANGICHRDIKPQNILCCKGGIYKVSDFGESKRKNKSNKNVNGLINYKEEIMNFEHNTLKQTIRGTELYMSPLLFRAYRNRCFEEVNYNAFKSDVFSLGLCMVLACSLGYKVIYEIRELTDMNKVKQAIEKYIKNYSKKFMNILYLMLEINEKTRPDFIELEKIINDNYNKI